MGVEDIKRLRDATGAGVLECKVALEGSAGDYQKAYDALLKKGVAKVAKRESKDANEGFVGSYVHSNGKIGAMVALNCETDFVAKNDLFQQLLKDVCMQITALNPVALRREDIAEDVVNEQKANIAEDAKGKPPEIVDKIVAGKMEAYYKENCLLDQPFIKDGDKTIQDLVNDVTAKTGEKIQINKFVRLEIGA